MSITLNPTHYQTPRRFRFKPDNGQSMVLNPRELLAGLTYVGVNLNGFASTDDYPVEELKAAFKTWRVNHRKAQLDEGIEQEMALLVEQTLVEDQMTKEVWRSATTEDFQFVITHQDHILMGAGALEDLDDEQDFDFEDILEEEMTAAEEPVCDDAADHFDYEDIDHPNLNDQDDDGDDPKPKSKPLTFFGGPFKPVVWIRNHVGATLSRIGLSVAGFALAFRAIVTQGKEFNAAELVNGSMSLTLNIFTITLLTIAAVLVLFGQTGRTPVRVRNWLLRSTDISAKLHFVFFGIAGAAGMWLLHSSSWSAVAVWVMTFGAWSIVRNTGLRGLYGSSVIIASGGKWTAVPAAALIIASWWVYLI